MPTRPTVTLSSRWICKQTPIEMTITRVTNRTVTYVALDKTFSGALPQWQFLQDFQPLPKRKRNTRRPA